ncbi:polyhydroxyalkanoate synthesis regulator phasin [Variovorax paradoxus]|uniref:Poly(3-hydroxyalkanoate) polymerase subunit PhaE n=1 Tax=Variovorax paradoxus TaxID=34073 RepID=A0AAW8E882_VARPD|nr:poly(R)-hydroxyalkanoic acid synthase subunit PhaE [Variovorax paradoxus]MDP9968921.1 polyhydroxyalkanoate synthesis regulator phasin [Variovorax paradoxus]
MSDATSTWADSWPMSQQALMKLMFPIQSPGESGATDTQVPMQEQFADLRDTWQESIEKWTELVKQGSKATPMTPETLRELFIPARWSGTGTGAFDAGLRQVLEGPKYAMLFDLDRKLLVLKQLALQRDKDVAALHAITLKAWNTAFERFSSSVVSTKVKAPATWRAMADQWLAVLNDTLIEVQRSEAFVEAQRKTLRSASDHRLQEREIAEAWCEAFHVPTRTEMDEMQRTVTELRRQLRALQRAGGPRSIGNHTTASPPAKRGAATKRRASVRS